MNELDDMLDSLRQLQVVEVEKTVAKRAESTLQEAIVRTLTLGQSPEGVAWAERKEGGRAYAHAASRVSTKAYGNMIRMSLVGPEVYGHYGVRGMPVRQMIPDSGAAMPKSVERALVDAAKDVFDAAVKG